MAVGTVSGATTGGSGHPQLVPVRPTPSTRHRMGTTRLHCRRSIFVVDSRSIPPGERPTRGTRRLCLQTVKPRAWNRDRGTEVVGYKCQSTPRYRLAAAAGLSVFFQQRIYSNPQKAQPLSANICRAGKLIRSIPSL